MTTRKFRLVKKEFLELSNFEGDKLWYAASVQVKILGMWWTLNTIEDLSKEYAENRAREIMEYITTDD